MQLCLKNPLEEIKNIVESKAKYQKVMLLFDDSVSNIEICEIHEAIKEFCIYNQSDINNLDKSEIYDGYKLIIYFCSIDSFLKSDFDRSEFVNIFFARTQAYLPFFLTNEGKVDNAENYLIYGGAQIDFSMLASVNFNIFYNNFRNILMNENKQIVYDELDLKVNNLNIIQHLIKIDENCFFIDVDILKKCYISYEDIVFVDLIVIDALMLLLSSIKNDYYMLVDVYKAGKESYELIEKFYKLYNNETFKTLVVLNYNRLYNMCLKTKQKIKDLICFFEIDAQNICDIIRKIKTYAKEDDDILAYLYLYNIFNV